MKHGQTSDKVSYFWGVRHYQFYQRDIGILAWFCDTWCDSSDPCLPNKAVHTCHATYRKHKILQECWNLWFLIPELASHRCDSELCHCVHLIWCFICNCSELWLLMPRKGLSVEHSILNEVFCMGRIENFP